VQRKTAYFQRVENEIDFIGDFGYFWKNLTNLDLDGHNLGTVLLARNFISSIIIRGRRFFVFLRKSGNGDTPLRSNGFTVQFNTLDLMQGLSSEIAFSTMRTAYNRDVFNNE
jgi:hypothetical protein